MKRQNPRLTAAIPQRAHQGNFGITVARLRPTVPQTRRLTTIEKDNVCIFLREDQAITIFPNTSRAAGLFLFCSPLLVECNLPMESSYSAYGSRTRAPALERVLASQGEISAVAILLPQI